MEEREGWRERWLSGGWGLGGECPPELMENGYENFFQGPLLTPGRVPPIKSPEPFSPVSPGARPGVGREPRRQ